MGSKLCDAVLGVIDIIHHEIRTTLVPNYGSRSKAAGTQFGYPLAENEPYTRDKWNNVLEVRQNKT